VDIQQQWKDLIAKGDKLQPKLIEAAEKAYTEAPNADKQITDFLGTLLSQMVQHDDYEPAAKIGKLLMDNKCPDKRAPLLAGVAAFAVSDYGTAERYLMQAAAGGGRLSVGRDYVDGLVAALLDNPDLFKQSLAREKALREAEAKADNLPRVLLKTSKGDIKLELFENEAPNTVANFTSLVEAGFYKDVPFHRVLSGFMAQGGDPKGNGQGGPGYNIACECYKPDHREHFRGTLSMAHAGRDTGGSQFFLTFVPTVSLNGKHTVFGRVIGGMDVVARLQRYDPDRDGERPKLDRIIEAKVLRKRPHDYKPQKMPE
jgi:cyclophilin family peptidyl-prolyl cis-trans isomerase